MPYFYFIDIFLPLKSPIGDTYTLYKEWNHEAIKNYKLFTPDVDARNSRRPPYFADTRMVK